jgi:hypothetical protein
MLREIDRATAPKSKLMHFLNSPLQFFLFIWYKQFTESRSVAAGRFLFKRFV